MSIFGLLNVGLTLALAMFVMGSTLCRMTQIDMKKVRYRYVLPILLFFCWAASVFFSLIGGDLPDWYQPLGLLAIGMHLWNNRLDWSDGAPAYMLQSSFFKAQFAGRVFTGARVRFENVCAVVLGSVTLAAAAVGALDGRGEPIQVYSAQAEVPIVNSHGPLKVIYEVRRVRYCMGYVDRFIVNAEGAPVQNFPTKPIGSSEIGRKVTIEVYLPLDDLPSGAYTYRVTAYHSCGDGRYVTRVPEIPFVVAALP